MKSLIRTIAFVFLFSTGSVMAQDVKKITNKTSGEEYYVLKSERSKRHGSYQKSGQKGEVLVQGEYSNGQRSGVWSFYSYNGELEQKYDFTKNELVFYKDDEKLKSKGYTVLGVNDTIETILDRRPIYIGGTVALYEGFSNITYPVKARENGISGTVIICFNIDKNGKASGHRVKNSVGYGCDEEALRVVKEIPDNWLPGLLNGEAVTVEYVIPVNFKLN